MKKCVVYIELVNGLIMRECHTQNHLHCSQFDDLAKSVLIIDVEPLMKGFSNEPCFVLTNWAIIIAFHMEDPLAATMFCIGLSGKGSQLWYLMTVWNSISIEYCHLNILRA